MNSCIESAPTRMRIASLRDMPLRNGMCTVTCPLGITQRPDSMWYKECDATLAYQHRALGVSAV